MPPTTIFNRETSARDLRIEVATEDFHPSPPHVNNGEENEYRTGTDLNYIANYSKGMHHNALGEVVPEDYRLMLKALNTGNPDDFDNIPLGTPPPVVMGDPIPLKFTNPQAGLAF